MTFGSLGPAGQSAGHRGHGAERDRRGGAGRRQLTGGRGTVIGTLLGVILVVIANNSLILIGVPTVWQRVVIGVIILIGTGLPAIRERQASKQAASVAE